MSWDSAWTGRESATKMKRDAEDKGFDDHEDLVMWVQDIMADCNPAHKRSRLEL